MQQSTRNCYNPFFFGAETAGDAQHNVAALLTLFITLLFCFVSSRLFWSGSGAAGGICIGAASFDKYTWCFIINIHLSGPYKIDEYFDIVVLKRWKNLSYFWLKFNLFFQLFSNFSLSVFVFRRVEKIAANYCVCYDRLALRWWWSLVLPRVTGQLLTKHCQAFLRSYSRRNLSARLTDLRLWHKTVGAPSIPYFLCNT